ncbi:hypothetical protein [Tenggerimyces flavus]|uniref:Uncharacterized protein n=1 Tax=Tenggerimyces flavus TaxID=1708749 RepID=A0ABV7YAV4_9ACTN|nr:hypothetical protein [Tenggerimyces flavus]MBM7789126.1 hypothetical protein [Tenggerimyces flavus]
MNDDSYAQDLYAAYCDLVQAAGDAIVAYLRENMISEVLDGELDELAAKFTDSWEREFGPYTWFSIDDVSDVAGDNLTPDFAESLPGALGAELRDQGTTLESLNLEHLWTGPAGSSYDTYRKDVTNAVYCQIELATTLKVLAQAQARLVAAAREGALQICRQTTASLRKEEEQQDTKRRERVATIVELFTTVTQGGGGGGKSGGIATAVGEAMKGIGKLAAQEIKFVEGDTPYTIYDAMIEALNQHKERLTEDAGHISASLLAFQSTLDWPDVNPLRVRVGNQQITPGTR